MVLITLFSLFKPNIFSQCFSTQQLKLNIFSQPSTTQHLKFNILSQCFSTQHVQLVFFNSTCLVSLLKLNMFSQSVAYTQERHISCIFNFILLFLQFLVGFPQPPEKIYWFWLFFQCVTQSLPHVTTQRCVKPCYTIYTKMGKHANKGNRMRYIILKLFLLSYSKLKKLISFRFKNLISFRFKTKQTA